MHLVGGAPDLSQLRYRDKTKVTESIDRAYTASATYLASLTGGIYLCHILFINEVRKLVGVTGLSHHLGWAETVAVLFVGTILISGLFTALILRTPLRWPARTLS